MEIVSAVHRALVGKVGQERFAVWFGRGVRMEPCGKTLRIAAADIFRLDFLRRKFGADLLEAARIAAGLQVELEYIVDAALAAQDAAESKVEGRKSNVGGEQQPRLTLFATQPEFTPPPPPTPQQPRRHFASLVEFISSDANRLAL